MSWNYRVCIEEGNYSIRECFYQNDKNPKEITAYSANPSWPFGDNRKQLKADLRRMMDALARPTINLDKKKGVRKDG